MKIRIYQIDKNSENGEELLFSNLDMHLKYTGHDYVMKQNYKMVFDGEVPPDNLEDVYIMFNVKLDQYPDFRGRPMSVSDVVEVMEDGVPVFQFCDSFGFKQVEFK